MTTSCLPASRFTISIVSLHTEHPALNTSIFFAMIFPLFDLFLRTAGRGHCDSMWPRIPHGCNHHEPDCRVHRGIRFPRELPYQHTHGRHDTERERSIAVPMLC